MPYYPPRALTEPLTSLLPVGRVHVDDQGVWANGTPILYDPSSATYVQKGWLLYQWDNAFIAYGGSFGDLNDSIGFPNAVAWEIESRANQVRFASYEWNGAGLVEIGTGVGTAGTFGGGGTHLSMNAVTGQTRPLIELYGGFQQFGNITDPAAPPDNNVRIYVRNNGGKDELVARFATGAIQRLAIEP